MYAEIIPAHDAGYSAPRFEKRFADTDPGAMNYVPQLRRRPVIVPSAAALRLLRCTATAPRFHKGASSVSVWAPVSTRGVAYNNIGVF